MMRRCGRVALAVLVAIAVVACGPDSAPAPDGTMVPVVDPASGQIVGQVPERDMDRVAREGGRADVTSNGEVVGHLTPDGFEPAEP